MVHGIDNVLPQMPGARELVQFFVRGKCEPAGSKKAVPMGRRWGVVDDNPAAEGWKKSVAGVAMVEMNGRQPYEGPMRVSMTFLLERPKSHYLTDGRSLSVAGRAFICHTQRPDALKLARAVEDAMSGVVYVDDNQIVEEHLLKRWTSPGEQKGVMVMVEPIANGVE